MKTMKLGSAICALTLMALSTSAFAQEAKTKIVCHQIPEKVQEEQYVIKSMEISLQDNGQYKVEMMSEGGPQQDPRYMKKGVESTFIFDLGQAQEDSTVLIRKYRIEHANNAAAPYNVVQTLTINHSNQTASLFTDVQRSLTGLLLSPLDGLAGYTPAKDETTQFDRCVQQEIKADAP